MIDHRNFEQTALPHMSRLYTYALRLTMNSEDAKDLLQETYLKAYQFWNTFEEGTNIKGWLYRIMKNSYINLYRKKIKEPKQMEYNESQGFYDRALYRFFDFNVQTGKSVEELFGDEIARSIESLPSDFRTIVMLSDVDELKYKEIAKMLACPVGTVRSRLHRGRKALKQKLLNFAADNGYILKKLEDSATLQNDGFKKHL